MTEPDVLFAKHGRVGRIALNRPKALNALSIAIIQSMHEQLCRWRNDDTVQLIVLHKVEGKAFCVGGDIREIFGFGVNSTLEQKSSLLKVEYALDYLIGSYPKPVLTLLNGITFGGGAGIALHTPFAVVTENTLFAMPEVKIGLSPDAGVDRLLAGLDRYCGIYIGMTGVRLSAADMLKLGLVQHDIAAKAIPTLLEQLVTLENITPECLECLLKNMPRAKLPPSQFTPEILDWIAKAFCSDSTAKIISQVSDDAKKSNSIANFAKIADESMQAGSPISLCLTHRLLRFEPQKLESTLQRNFIIGQNCFQHGDFYEGVRALLIDKDNAPNWRYESLSEIENQIYDKFLTPILPPLELDIIVS